ncbi:MULTISPECIES: hypothetical protein [Rhodanobacter]|uniref:hypothetical protein n=1 Tax=Rhodanobacter TaxID=75309 RepID=UPI0012DBF70C|nr:MULTISPECIES: hypothetical protein [Rhodanobacter]UJJ58017.1 hypothetical protein LRK55_15320 [Rhodanobacter denitrificans]
MIASLPEALQHGQNQKVLAYLAERSAHSDIAIPLWQAVKKLPNVRLYCSDRQNFGYVVVYVGTLAFGFAEGMGGVTLRLPPMIVEQLISQGAEHRSTIGPEWIFLRLFGNGGFQSQLATLAGIAHQCAEPPSNNSFKADGFAAA